MAKRAPQRFAARMREQERKARAARKRARKEARRESGDTEAVPIVDGPQFDRPDDDEVLAAIERAMNPGGMARERAPHPAKTAASRLFVGNLPHDVDNSALRTHFTDAGYDCVDASVILDRDTGASRGFAFVELDSPQSARHAVENLDGIELMGRELRVRLANDRPGR